MSDETPTIEIPDDLIALQREWAAADADVHARIAEIERAETEYTQANEGRRAPLPTTPDDPGRADDQLAKLRMARSDLASTVRERVTALAADPARYWLVRNALDKAAA